MLFYIENKDKDTESIWYKISLHLKTFLLLDVHQEHFKVFQNLGHSLYCNLTISSIGANIVSTCKKKVINVFVHYQYITVKDLAILNGSLKAQCV